MKTIIWYATTSPNHSDGRCGCAPWTRHQITINNVCIQTQFWIFEGKVVLVVTYCVLISCLYIDFLSLKSRSIMRNIFLTWVNKFTRGHTGLDSLVTGSIIIAIPSLQKIIVRSIPLWFVYYVILYFKSITFSNHLQSGNIKVRCW